jgi:hypothetical protein
MIKTRTSVNNVGHFTNDPHKQEEAYTVLTIQIKIFWVVTMCNVVAGYPMTIHGITNQKILT